MDQYFGKDGTTEPGRLPPSNAELFASAPRRADSANYQPRGGSERHGKSWSGWPNSRLGTWRS